jgi:isoquinoline 1-oxidoreductase beta subunit
MYSLAQQDRSPSRRVLLQGGLAGVFVFGFHLPARAVNEPEQPPDSTQGKFAPNAFIRIDRSGQTTLVMPQVEMGQGVYTAIPMILAEELDADFGKVVLQHAPPDDNLYGNPVLGIQVTGNSNSIRAFWKPLRTAGAATRLMLVQAAAKQWASRSDELLDIQRHSQSHIERTHARLRRLDRCREDSAGPARSAA